MKKIFFSFVFFIPVVISAQQMTLQTAIETALKNNFDILIAKNDVEVSKLNNTYGMAGGLPNISVNASDNSALNNTYTKMADGTESTNNNAFSNNINAGLNAGMLLFNGFRVVATKERLSLLQQQSELFLNRQIQNTIAAVMMKYYDIIRQQGYLKIMQNSLDVSKKKLDIVNARKEVGMANNVDLLQAQMDVNAADQSLKIQQMVIDQAKTDLQMLMCVKQYTTYIISDSIVVDRSLKLDSILALLNKNPQYLSAEQQVKINEQIVKELSAQRFPAIRINTGYNFYNSQNDASSVQLSQYYGPIAGVTVQVPIYNGNVYRNEKKIASYKESNANLEKQNLLNALTADAVKSYHTYKTTLQQMDTQQNNFQLAKELVYTVMQKFQLNQATILEVKAAQTSLENAGYLLMNLQFAAKSAEIELKQMIFRLGY